MILQTLAELEADEGAQQSPQSGTNHDERAARTASMAEAESKGRIENPKEEVVSDEEPVTIPPAISELRFLENLRERILVLFEGFQAPNNKNFEAKLDLTLNFFEYLLATIEKRVEELRRT